MTKISASVCLVLDMALSCCAYAIFWFAAFEISNILFTNQGANNWVQNKPLAGER